MFFLASISGNTGVLHMLETDSDLNIILNTGPHAPYMVLMDAPFFNRYTHTLYIYVERLYEIINNPDTASHWFDYFLKILKKVCL